MSYATFSKQPRGFTLIEVLLYVSLLGLLMTGVFASAISISFNSQRINAEALLQREARFLEQSLVYRIQNATQVDVLLGEDDNSILRIDGTSVSVRLGELVLSDTQSRMLLSSEVTVRQFVAQVDRSDPLLPYVDFMLTISPRNGSNGQVRTIERRVSLSATL